MARPAKVRYQVYEFIADFKKNNDGNPPTYRQISNHFGWKSESTAWEHVAGLCAEGKARLDDHGRIKLPGERWRPPPDWIPLEPLAIEKPSSAKPKRKRENVRTEDNVQTMYKAQKGLCWWCGVDLLGVYEVDHRYPWSKGGPDDLSNLCLACPDCNTRKGKKLPHEFNGRLI